MSLQSRVIHLVTSYSFFLSKWLQVKEKKKSQKIPASSKRGSGSHPCGQENVAPAALSLWRREGNYQEEGLARWIVHGDLWILVLTHLPASLFSGLVESLCLWVMAFGKSPLTELRPLESFVSVIHLTVNRLLPEQHCIINQTFGAYNKHLFACWWDCKSAQVQLVWIDLVAQL